MNTDSSKKLHGCTLYTMQQRNFDTQKCNEPYNLTATISLKGSTKLDLEKTGSATLTQLKMKTNATLLLKI